MDPVEIDDALGQADRRRDQFGDAVGVFQADHVLAQQFHPAAVDLRIVVVAGQVGKDEVGVVLRFQLADHLLDGDVLPGADRR